MTIYLPQTSHFVNLQRQAEQVQNLIHLNLSNYHHNPYYNEWFQNEHSIPNIQEHLTNQCTYLVIERQIEIIGISILNKRTGELSLQIHKNHQGKGHSKILFAKTLPHHPNPYTLIPALDNKTITVFQKQGFQTTQTLTHPIFGETLQLTKP